MVGIFFLQDWGKYGKINYLAILSLFLHIDIFRGIVDCWRKIMKLLNLDEEAPEFFYIFMNPGNDIVGKALKHNFQLNKRLISASFQSFLVSPEKYIKGEFQHLPFIKNENSTSVPSSFVLHTIKNYALEYNLETYRMSYYPTFPSRLGALYAFGNLDTCAKVSKKYG